MTTKKATAAAAVSQWLLCVLWPPPAPAAAESHSSQRKLHPRVSWNCFETIVNPFAQFCKGLRESGPEFLPELLLLPLLLLKVKNKKRAPRSEGTLLANFANLLLSSPTRDTHL